MLAALFGVVGVARSENSVAYFGVYSALVGLLLLRSTFFPRFIGVLMLLTGIGLLMTTYGPLLLPTEPRWIPSVGLTLDAGEIVFALWLTIFGVDHERWRCKVIAGEAA